MKDRRNLPENLNKDDLEREKLKEEITDLRHQNSQLGRIVKLVPVLTTFVAVAGLAFTFYNAQRTERAESEARHRETIERERNYTLDRLNRIQAQIRSDKEQMLDFLTTDKISSIRMGFLIEDLRSLIDQMPQDESQKAAKDAVTELLRRIAWDLSFTEKRDPLFDVQALRRWSDYKQSWLEFRDSHHLFLVRKYFHAIQQLREKNAQCIEKLDYVENTMILSYPNGCDEDLIGALIYGFGERLRALKTANQLDLLDEEVREFGRLTNNASFAEKFAERLDRPQ